MRIIKQLKFLSILVICTVSVFAETGETGANFLKISPGARPVGMGGAYTAIATDINALYYNPAGIVRSRQYQIGATHTEWLEGIKYDFAGGIIPTGKGAIGISAIYLTTGKIEGRDEQGNKSKDFYSSDLAITLTHARQINSRTQIGGSIKIIKQTIADEDANGIAVDIGIKQEISNRLNLGLTVRNLGPKMKFIEEKYSLPLSMTAGISYNLTGILNLAMDMTYEPIEKKKVLCIGTEIMPAGFITLRAGYLFQAIQTFYNSNDKLTEQNGFGGGIGIRIFGYNLDYAIVPYSHLGTTQRVSFDVRF